MIVRKRLFFTEQRKLWTKALKRKKQDKTDWLLKNSARVCSIHFVDGIFTTVDLVPTLHLGYRNQMPKFHRSKMSVIHIRNHESNVPTGQRLCTDDRESTLFP